MAYTLSPGLLYGTLSLIRLSEQQSLRLRDIARSLGRIADVPAEYVLSFALDSKVLSVSGTGEVIVSKSSSEIGQGVPTASQLRVLLKEFVLNGRPPWAHLITRGRAELGVALSRGARQCFADAELFSTPPTDEIVQWWDKLAVELRAHLDEEQLATGRIGERLSIEHEIKRTGLTPRWMSIESNLTGYDLLSVVSRSNGSPLIVEVKASRGLGHSARFFMSRNEWETACKASNYSLHLWRLAPTPALAKVSVSILEPHIPINCGDGVWDSVQISMAAFESSFRSVEGFWFSSEGALESQ